MSSDFSARITPRELKVEVLGVERTVSRTSEKEGWVGDLFSETGREGSEEGQERPTW